MGKAGGKRKRPRARTIDEIPALAQVRTQAFLAELRQGHSVMASLAASELPRSVAYQWRHDDEAFAAAWKEAYDEGTEFYEDVARARIITGTPRPVFYKGEKCGTIMEVDNDLLKFILSARDPAKYRTRHEISGPNGQPLAPPVTQNMTLVSLTIEAPPAPPKQPKGTK